MKIRSLKRHSQQDATEACLQGLGRTLFERLHALYGEEISQMLTMQYRMNKSIMEWSSKELYGGCLRAHPSVADHTLQELLQQV